MEGEEEREEVGLNDLEKSIHELTRSIMKEIKTTDPLQLVPSLLPLLSKVRELLALGQQVAGKKEIYEEQEPLITVAVKELVVHCKALQKGELPSREIAIKSALSLCEKSMILIDQLRPKIVAPPEFQEIFDRAVHFIQLLARTMEKFSENPATIETDLIQPVSSFKDILGLWAGTPILQTLLQDEKLTLLSQLQQIVAEAKKISAQDPSMQPQNVVYGLLALGELVGDWFGIKFNYSLAVEVAYLSKEKDQALIRLKNRPKPPVSGTESEKSPTFDPPPKPVLEPEQPARNTFETFMKLKENSSKGEVNEEEIISKKSYYHHATLKKWGAQFFARARADFTPGAEHGDLALNFKKNDLIAVFNDEGDLWQGANPETEKFGYFPKAMVAIVSDSLRLKQREAEEQARKPLNEAVFRKEQEEKQKAKEEEQKKKEPPPPKEYRAKMQVKGPKKKWEDMDMILQGFNLLYTKHSESKKETKTLVSINLTACILSPSKEKEVGKENLDRSFKILEKGSGDQTLFIASSKAEATEWLEALTLASLSLSKDDLALPEHYEFGSSSVRKLKLEGFDSRGNSFILKEKRQSQAKNNEHGSLTQEEMEHYSRMLPSKSMIEKMSNEKKRTSIFKAFQK